MRKKVKKLALSKETIRRIEAPGKELAKVAGGFTDSCESWCTCGWTQDWSIVIGQGC
jgi:hypothetical protein